MPEPESDIITPEDVQEAISPQPKQRKVLFIIIAAVVLCCLCPTIIGIPFYFLGQAGESAFELTELESLPVEDEPPVAPVPDQPPQQVTTAPAGELHLSNLHVEYILDASAVMNRPLTGDGPSKGAVAADALRWSLQAYRPQTNLGLRVFGYRHAAAEAEASCQDAGPVVPLAPGSYEPIKSWLAGYQAQGAAPLTLALEQAIDSFALKEPDHMNHIVLVSGGEESCNRDPCALVNEWRDRGFDVTVDVVGLGVNESARQQLACIAEAGQGSYYDAPTAEAFSQALAQIQQSLSAAETVIPAAAALLPTAQPSPTTPATPVVDFNDLSPYREAMLPEFANEVEMVAESGASRYYLEVSLDPASFNSGSELRLKGRERVRYTNTEETVLSDIYFRLYPNLAGYGGQMTVDTVIVDNQPVKPELAAEKSALRVPLPAPLAPGATTDISLSYEAVVPSGTDIGYNIFSYSDNTIALAGFYPAIAVYDDLGWDTEVPPPYGDATYLDTAFYQVELTVPEPMVVAASGNLLEQESNNNGTQTLRLVSGPMRDFYVVMRPDYESVSEVVDGTVVTSYYPPDLKSGGLLALEYAVDSLEVFNERFGQYPYAEFDIAATPNNAGGVEYPGIVVINQRLYNQPGGFFEHAAAHEVAHQWWYGLVGNDQVDEPWLDESLTNYSAVLYWEAVAGDEAAEKVVEQLFWAPYNQAREQGQDRAVTGSVADFTAGEYGTFVYGKGPLFFHTLRQSVGDELFFDIFRTYYSEYKHKLAYTDDLLEVIEQRSGQDIDPLFETWMETPEN